jgi:hypothetical protein
VGRTVEVLTVGIIGALKLVLTRRFPAPVKLVVVLALYLMALPVVSVSRSRDTSLSARRTAPCRMEAAHGY